MPCAIFSGYLGSELQAVNPRIKSIACPFTGETLTAVPALRPDVAVIHAQKADRAGNVLIAGIIGVQKEAVLAAQRAVATVEEIVDDLGTTGTNAIVLPVVDLERGRAGAGRRPAIVCARLLRARQRVLHGVGRDRARPRAVHGVDRRQRQASFGSRGA